MFYDSETEFDVRERRRQREMERQLERRRQREAKREARSAFCFPFGWLSIDTSVSAETV